MSTEFSLDAEVRSLAGKGASRRLRREESRVPGIIYGGDAEPVQISVELRTLVKALENEAFYSQIITLKVDGKEEATILRDLQRHPSKGVPLHADFQRVDMNKAIHTRVPLHFINEESCVGVKMDGGSITHNMSELEVSCLPKDLPEYIEVDLAEVAAGTIVHISDVKLPEGVTSVDLAHGDDHNHPVATVNKPKRGADAEEAAADAPAEGGDDAAE